MERDRLSEILAAFQDTQLLVVGDYFLDKYLDIERSLAEQSLETGLEAHQVVAVRTSPGAAGNVVANLRALGVGVTCLTVVGDDGEGYVLLRELRGRGANTDAVVQTPQRMTPTYTKPMMREPDGRVHELSRLDIKNRSPLPGELEDAVIQRLRALVPGADGIVIADQVQERNYGVVTDGVREALIELAGEHPAKSFIVDSRERIGAYRQIMLKPNDREAVHAVQPEHKGDIGLAQAREAGLALSQRSGRAVFVTVGASGTLVCDGAAWQRVPAVRVKGPLDIVGAGDSTLAGIISALCCGASPTEAALVGNLVASVTIRQLGTTGTATQAQVLAAFDE